MSVLRQPTSQSGTYDLALESALSELERAQTEIRDLRSALAVVEARAREKRRLVNMLLKNASPEKVVAYQQRLAEMQTPFRLGRAATTTFDNVIELFKETPTRVWSANDAHHALEAKGIPAEPDQIHNIFQYLNKRGLLKRISRGRYSIVGYGIGVEGDPEGGYD